MASTPLSQSTVEAQLASPDWKVRCLAYDTLLTQLPIGGAHIITEYGFSFPRFLTENTPAALDKGLQVVNLSLTCLGTTSQTLVVGVEWTSLLRSLIEKVYSTQRPTLASASSAVLQVLWTRGDKTQLAEVINQCLTNKNPKVQLAALTAMKQVLLGQGVRNASLSFALPHVLGKCSEPNPAIRTAAMDYLKELGRIQGKSVLCHLKGLKPIQLSEIENHIAISAPPLADVVESTSTVPNHQLGLSDAEFWNQIPAAKVLQKFPEAWADKVLAEGSWVEKKNKLDSLDKALTVEKLEFSQFTHLSRMLKQLLGDSSVPVQLVSLSILKKLCSGLRHKFSPGIRVTQRALLLRLRDRKPLLAEAVSETLEEALKWIGLEEVIEEFKDQLKEKNPLAKTHLLRILTQHVQKYGDKVVKNPALTKTLTTCAKENLIDGTPEVRRFSEDLLVGLLQAAPKDQGLLKDIGSIEEKKKNRILELASKGAQIDKVEPRSLLHRSPTQESLTVGTPPSVLKKSQSVAKYPVAGVNKSNIDSDTVGKKSLTTKASQLQSIKIPPTQYLPSVQSLLDELRPTLSHTEALNFIISEQIISKSLADQGEKGAWKDRLQALGCFKGKTSFQDQRYSESVMVIIRKWTGEFKEPNPILIKEVFELLSQIAPCAGSKSCHLVVEFLVEKAQHGKNDSDINTIIESLQENMGLRKLAVSLLTHTKDKASNPKLLASSLAIIMNLIPTDSSVAFFSLPIKEITAFVAGAIQNPNPLVRQAATLCFASLLSAQPNSPVLQSAFNNLPPPQRKQVTTAKSSQLQKSVKHDEEIANALSMLEKGVIVSGLGALTKKHKDAFKKVAPKAVQLLCRGLDTNPDSIITLRTLYDIFGDQVFEETDFKLLPQTVRNEVMRTPVVDPNSPVKAMSFGTERQSATKVIASPMNMEPLPMHGDPEPMNTERLKHTTIPHEPTVPVSNHILKLKPSPIKLFSADTTLSRQDARNNSSKPSTPNNTDLIQSVDLPIQWLSLHIDPLEIKDQQVADLRLLLRNELGSDLTDRMFSLEILRLSEAILKVETKMKQKQEVKGFWELVLKWVLVRVFDCARDTIIHGLAHMVDRLLGFADRGGRHLSEGEAILIYHIMVRIISNETSSSAKLFIDTFKYRLMQDYSSKIVLLFLTILSSQTLRYTPPVKLLFSEYLSALPSLLIFTHLHTLVDQVPAIIQPIILALPETEQIALTILDPPLPQSTMETINKWLIEGRTTYNIEKPEVSAHNPALEGLLAEIVEASTQSGLKNLVTLKKIVEVTKVKCYESEAFLTDNGPSIASLLCFLLNRYFNSVSSFEQRIADMEGNFEFLRTLLEYLQKVAGSLTILSSMTLLQFNTLSSTISDTLVRTDSDKRRLDANMEGLKTDKLTKCIEIVSKFLNSAVLRLLEGPPTRVFESFFSILTETRRQIGEHPDAAKKLKVLVRCILKLSKSIDSASSVNVPEVLRACMDYVSLFPAAEELDRSDLGVKTVKTVLTDFCSVFGQEMWTFYARSSPFPPSDAYIKKWLHTLLSDSGPDNDKLSILSGRRSVLRLDQPIEHNKSHSQRTTINTQLPEILHRPKHNPDETISVPPEAHIDKKAETFQKISNLPSQAITSAHLETSTVPSFKLHKVEDEKKKRRAESDEFKADSRQESLSGASLYELELLDIDDPIEEPKAFNQSFGADSKYSPVSVTADTPLELHSRQLQVTQRKPETVSLGKRSITQKPLGDDIDETNNFIDSKRKVNVIAGKQSLNSKPIASKSNHCSEDVILNDLIVTIPKLDIDTSPLPPARQIFALNQYLQNSASPQQPPPPAKPSISPESTLISLIHDYSQCTSVSLHSQSTYIKQFMAENGLSRALLQPHLASLTPLQRTLLQGTEDNHSEHSQLALMYKRLALIKHQYTQGVVEPLARQTSADKVLIQEDKDKKIVEWREKIQTFLRQKCSTASLN